MQQLNKKKTTPAATSKKSNIVYHARRTKKHTLAANEINQTAAEYKTTLKTKCKYKLTKGEW